MGWGGGGAGVEASSNAGVGDELVYALGHRGGAKLIELLRSEYSAPRMDCERLGAAASRQLYSSNEWRDAKSLSFQFYFRATENFQLFALLLLLPVVLQALLSFNGWCR